MTQTNKTGGSCLCRAVRYEISGPMPWIVYCHCEQCRKTSGHFVAATRVGLEDLHIVEDSGLEWYKSSEMAARGFCKRCGSSLFWRPSHGEYMVVMAGAIDTPTGLSGREHIFTADASDYYDITDGLAQFEQGHPGLWEEDGA